MVARGHADAVCVSIGTANLALTLNGPCLVRIVQLGVIKTLPSGDNWKNAKDRNADGDATQPSDHLSNP